MKQMLELIIGVAAIIGGVVMLVVTIGGSVNDKIANAVKEERRACTAKFEYSLSAKESRIMALEAELKQLKSNEEIAIPEASEEAAEKFEVIVLLPKNKTNVFRYMDYRKITDKSTPQYKLQQECETGFATGIRIYTDSDGDEYYCTAMGGAYASSVGEAWHIELEGGDDFNVICAEFKKDPMIFPEYFGDPDENYDGEACTNVIEFVVDVSRTPAAVRDKGSYAVIFGGIYGDGANIKKMTYLGRVWK